MIKRHVWLIAGFAFVALLPVMGGCKDAVAVDYVTVSLANSETYSYPTVGGDEEGAGITVQPRHFRVSEMRRNAETKWVATFVYQPAAGYVGMDRAEVETLTGSDGASPPTHVHRIVFTFEVHN